MANLKNTNIDDNLELPEGTTAQRPASPQEGQIRYNTDLAVTEFYNGSNWILLSDNGIATSYDIEIITNGNFSDGVNGWTVDGVSTSTSGNTVTLNGSGDLTQQISLTAGKTYKISANVKSIENAQANLKVDTDSTGAGGTVIDNSTAPGHLSGTFQASSNSIYVAIQNGQSDSSSSITWSDVSVRENSDSTVVDTDIGGVPYRIHYFTEVGNSTFTIINSGLVEGLIVAGGGGGGNPYGGGGGGGFAQEIQTFLEAGTYTVEVGNGGSPGDDISRNEAGGKGGNSSAFGYISLGGGGGQGLNGIGQSDGGTGGGGNRGNSDNDTGGVGSQGGNGGDGFETSNTKSGGGGGGASTDGVTGTDGRSPDGGLGIATLITGTPMLVGGGGGGGCDTRDVRPNPGLGYYGGGNGFASANAENGKPNSGGGGGGGSFDGSYKDAGRGGTGIVIVKYPKTSLTKSQPDRQVSSTQPNRFNIIQNDLVLNYDVSNLTSYKEYSSIIDISGNNVNGILQGDVNLNGKDSIPYLNFDGSGDFISVGSVTRLNAGNSERTMFAWIYTLETKRGVIINQGGGGTTEGSFDFEVNVYTQAQNPTNFYGIHYWGNGITFDQEVVHNQWVFVAVSHQGGDLSPTNTFGLFNGTRMNLTGTSPINTNNSEVSIGDNPDNGGNDVYFKGKIGEVGIYNRGLTELELVNIFNNTRGRYGI